MNKYRTRTYIHRFSDGSVSCIQLSLLPGDRGKLRPAKLYRRPGPELQDEFEQWLRFANKDCDHFTDSLLIK